MEEAYLNFVFFWVEVTTCRTGREKLPEIAHVCGVTVACVCVRTARRLPSWGTVIILAKRAE